MAVLALCVALAAVPLAGAAAVPAAPYAPADGGRPTVHLSQKEAGKGGSLTVTGRGWRPKALLTLLICGQNMIGGTNACANGDGRAVTTDAHGAFHKNSRSPSRPSPAPVWCMWRP